MTNFANIGSTYALHDHFRLATGNGLTVATNANVVVLASVNAITLAGNRLSNGAGSRNTDIRIDGYVMGDLAGAALGGTVASVNDANSVYVGAPGHVIGVSDSGVWMFGDLAMLFNAGEIMSVASAGGIIITDLGARIENNGAILGRSYGISGGEGNEIVINRGVIQGGIFLNNGFDSFDGAQGSAVQVNGGNNADTLRGPGFDDTLSGDTDSDRLFGRDGDDVMNGGSLNDRLRGQGGEDQINGGSGIDVMTGGADADVFVFSFLTDMGNAVTSDRITDFVSGTDQIDLSAISGLTFIGGLSFTSVVDQMRYVKSAGQLQIDHTGDSVADFVVQLTPNVALVASDLNL